MEKIPYSSIIDFRLSIGFSQACQSEKFPISDYFEDEEEWDEWSGEEQRYAIEECHETWRSNYIDSGWTVDA